MSASLLENIHTHQRLGKPICLFLDYDGTLVPIARTPDEAQPDAALIDLLTRLSVAPNITTVILSGRPLSALETMFPIPGLELAGLYGVETRSRSGNHMVTAEERDVRPVIEQVKLYWTALVKGLNGFLIEDKGLSVALHARFASYTHAHAIMPLARTFAERLATPDQFRIFAGERFLEIAPASAHKGRAVERLLNHFGFANVRPIYFGDDDKDEEAFAIIRQHGGFPIRVGLSPFPTQALVRLPSPAAVREWLSDIADMSEVNLNAIT